jgi:hypothetical protein
MSIAMMAPLAAVVFFAATATVGNYLKQKTEFHEAAHAVTFKTVTQSRNILDMNRFSGTRHFWMKDDTRVLAASKGSDRLAVEISQDPRVMNATERGTRLVSQFGPAGEITELSLTQLVRHRHSRLISKTSLSDGSFVVSLTRLDPVHEIEWLWLGLLTSLTFVVGALPFARRFAMIAVEVLASRNQSARDVPVAAAKPLVLPPPPVAAAKKIERAPMPRFEARVRAALLQASRLPSSAAAVQTKPKRRPVPKTQNRTQAPIPRPPLPPTSLMASKRAPVSATTSHPNAGRAFVKVTDALGNVQWSELPSKNAEPRGRDVVAARSLRKLADL